MTAEPGYLHVRHLTRFLYSEPVREAVMTLYKQPRSDASQHVETFEIRTSPRAGLHDYEDCFGNAACFFDIPGEHQELRVEAQSVVAVHRQEQDPDLESPGWDAMTGLESGSLWHFLNPTPLTAPTPRLAAFVKEHGIERLDTPLDSLRLLARRLHETIAYDPGATMVHSPVDHALETGRGVCQDHAHLMLAVARSWGVPARYASGYLHVERPDDPDALMARGSHAWVECLLPNLGWIGFDPTNDTMPSGRHIRVATGRDYQDVPPTRGTFRGTAAQTLEVSVGVKALSSESRNDDGTWPEFDAET